jgi:DNA-damage-inducible protein J
MHVFECGLEIGEPGLCQCCAHSKHRVDARQPMSRRLKAAVEAAPFVHPKLAVAVSISEADFASRLDRAIERSRLARQGQLIEGRAIERPATGNNNGEAHSEALAAPRSPEPEAASSPGGSSVKGRKGLDKCPARPWKSDMTRRVEARIDEEIARKAEEVLQPHGLNLPKAFRLMVTQIAKEKALPFTPLEPNADTIAAMEAARRGELVTFGTIEEMFAHLHADD